MKPFMESEVTFKRPFKRSSRSSAMSPFVRLPAWT